MKQEYVAFEGNKDLFLWILSLIRSHAVSGLLADSIH